MSEQGSDVLSEQPNDGSGANGSSSLNGEGPEIGVGVTEGSTAQAPTDDEGMAFLAELVRGMQATAALERARIGEDIERRRQAHIDEVRSREAAEADRMRELAGDDMKAIETWADGEAKRIQLERERRAKDLHADLDQSLAEHRSKIDGEIDRIEAAIATYRVEVEAFFDGLGRQTDPVLIAQQAAKRPRFPALVAVDATVTGDSSAEPPGPEAADGAAGSEGGDAPEPEVVGVMDPDPAAEPVESWADQAEPSPDPVPVGAADEDQRAEAVDSAEPVARAGGVGHGNGGFLLASMPVIRPMGWLRREPHDADRSSPER